MNKFYDHPKFIDVRLEVRGPAYGGTKYVRIKGTWWLKREFLPWINEEMTILKSNWERFVKGCEEYEARKKTLIS